MTLTEFANDRVTWALGGALIALLGAYFAFSREVTRDVHTIKGQLMMILQQFHALQRLSEKHAVLDKEHDKTRADMNMAFIKLRSLELKGEKNGT